MTDPGPVAAVLALDRFAIGRWHIVLESGEIWWDEGMRRLTGYETPTDPETWVQQAVLADERSWLREKGRAWLRGGPFSFGPSRIVRPDGEVRWLRVEGTVHLGPDGIAESAVGAAMDVTDEMALRERLAEAQRTETLGRFSAGISHNFNNMLMIIGFLLLEIRDAIASSPEIPAQTRADVDDALEATHRAEKVVRQLASLARAEGQSAVVEDVGETCEKLARLLRHALPEGVTLSTDITRRLTVRAAPGGVEQIVHNLLQNARDALVDHDSPERHITLSVRETRKFDASWIEVLVTDTGPGVPPALRETLFEPFVTTKGAGGTGLGLASSASIAERLGGQMAHREREGGGAEFLLVLPAVEDSTSVEASAAPREPGATEGAVLVVDDEPVLLRAVRDALRRAGFEAVGAASRDEVVGLLEGGFQPRVVLLDRSVDRAHGATILADLAKSAVQARVVFFTGEPVSTDDLALVDGIIRKPAKVAFIVERVAELAAEDDSGAGLSGRG